MPTIKPVPFGRIVEYRQPYIKARSVKYYLITGATSQESNPIHVNSSTVVADSILELVNYIKANPCKVVDYERYDFRSPSEFKQTEAADMLELFQALGAQ